MRIMQKLNHSLGQPRKFIISGFVKFGIWIIYASTSNLSSLLVLINNHLFLIGYLTSKGEGLGWRVAFDQFRFFHKLGLMKPH